MNWLQLLSHRRLGEGRRGDGLDQARSAFEVDYDRIIFSHPFRRLQDKTQVLPLPEHDFVHTRLTHSLEVSSVGRSLGKKVGEELIVRHEELLSKQYTSFDFGAIVAAASLTHDLGNPPFGHSGEAAISDFFLNNPNGNGFKEKVNDKEWADLTAFEGNAQGFRILNKKGAHGLKLTMASLAAFSKYPRESLIDNRDANRTSQKKYGFFQSEKESFAELANELGLVNLSIGTDLAWCRHPLSFLVEAADDICYGIIDFEDGCRLGLVSYEQTVELLSEIIGGLFDESKLKKIPGRNERIGVLRAMAINELVQQVSIVFLANEADILSGSFDSALTNRIPASDKLKKIERLSVEKIYRSTQVMEREAAGFQIIDGLLNAFSQATINKIFDQKSFSSKQKSVFRLLPETSIYEIENQKSPYEVLLCVTDFISGLTDSYALTLYQRINGMSVPGSRRL
ncbi:MAG: deoxyguanosinetriphosphate triphosphohydrolase [Bacteroidetes bacterium]|nr:deoxyguanosinetriphosphate triphosphohydrolase [Bacteroidota bacterium]MDA1120067.1 deoxyguanosinetriphosphate triphosphohydrolase [Bacteroidota bacterium]